MGLSQVTLGRKHDSSLSLDRLNQEACCATRGKRFLELRKISERNTTATFQERFKRPAHPLVAHHGKRTEVGAMESALAIDEFRPAGGGPGKLQARLCCLASTVREKSDLEWMREHRECLGQFSGMNRRADVGDVHRFAGEELLEPPHEPGMTVPNVDGAKTRQEIEIAPALVVPNPDVLCPDKYPSVSKHAEQPHQSRIHMPREFFSRRIHGFTGGPNPNLRRPN